MKLSWSQFKSVCITRKNLSIQFVEAEAEYEIWAWEQGDKYTCAVHKDIPRNSEQEDFEDNFKAYGNWAVGQRPYAFASGDFDFNGDGVLAECQAGQDSTIDYTVEQDLYINGGTIVLEGSALGDWIEVHVVHPVYGQIKTYIKKRYVPASPPGSPSPLMEIRTPYAGKIPAGLKLRLIYHSTGASLVKVGINYDFHKAI